MKVYFPDVPDLPVPDGHRFPVSKYRLLKEHVTAEGILRADELVPSPVIARTDLERAHAARYIADVMDGTLSPEAVRRIGIPWSVRLAERSCLTVGGTLAAARTALEYGISGQLAGGTHHAHAEFGSGYCVFNDIAVAALALIDAGHLSRVAVVDLDVHQGDGTAALLAGHPDVFTLSIHGEKNFPFRKVPSDLDIGLADGTDDEAYLAALDGALDAAYASRPDLVFYLAGVDPLRSDKLGRLDLTFDGLMRRDRMVFERSAARAIPVCVVAGGGYASPIDDTVRAYANTWTVARSIYRV